VSEVCLHADFRLSPRWDIYLKLEDAGLFRVYTARKGHKLIGYAIYNVMPNMHYIDVLHATQDALYLHPDYRGGSSGIKLIKYADERLARMGVDLVSHHVKVKNDFSPILKRLGYSQSEKIYEKRLN